MVSPVVNTVEIFKLGDEGHFLFPEMYAADDVIKVEHFPDFEINLVDIFGIPVEEPGTWPSPKQASE